VRVNNICFESADEAENEKKYIQYAGCVMQDADRPPPIRIKNDLYILSFLFNNSVAV